MICECPCSFFSLSELLPMEEDGERKGTSRRAAEHSVEYICIGKQRDQHSKLCGKLSDLKMFTFGQSQYRGEKSGDLKRKKVCYGMMG